MAYRIKGVVRLSDDGDANLGIVTATSLVGKISSEAITEQTDGDALDVSGADELLLYDEQNGDLLRVSVDEFISGSGIGTIVTNFDFIDVGVVTANSFIQSSGPSWTTGSGVPEGVVTAPVGSLYSRTDGSASPTLYVKESGTGNTGWVAK